MCEEARATGEKRNDYCKRRTRVAKHLNRQQCAANWPNDGVNSVPDRIYPGNFVGKKLEEIENTGDADDPWVAEDFERLILRRESDPVEMNGEPAGENGEVKIDACERSQAERDGEQVKLFHVRNICVNLSMSRAGFITGSSDAEDSERYSTNSRASSFII